MRSQCRTSADKRTRVVGRACPASWRPGALSVPAPSRPSRPPCRSGAARPRRIPARPGPDPRRPVPAPHRGWISGAARRFGLLIYHSVALSGSQIPNQVVSDFPPAIAEYRHMVGGVPGAPLRGFPAHPRWPEALCKAASLARSRETPARGSGGEVGGVAGPGLGRVNSVAPQCEFVPGRRVEGG